jgi:hypothetical protein
MLVPFGRLTDCPVGCAACSVKGDNIPHKMMEVAMHITLIRIAFSKSHQGREKLNIESKRHKNFRCRMK